MVKLVIYNPEIREDYIEVGEFKTTEACDIFTGINFTDKNHLIKSYTEQSGEKVDKKYSMVGIIRDESTHPLYIQPVVYSDDCFDNVDVFNKFADYYMNNPNEVIKKWRIGIEYMYVYQNYERVQIKDSIKEFSTSELYQHVRSFLIHNDRYQYKKLRDVYFRLKRLGIKVKKTKIQIDKDAPFPNFEIGDDEDSFANSLLGYARHAQLNGEDISDLEDEFMMAFDVEDLERFSKNSGSKGMHR